MNSKIVEASVLFALSLLNAVVALMSLRSNTGTAMFFAIISAALGFSAFWVIFQDIRRTAKLLENQSAWTE